MLSQDSNSIHDNAHFVNSNYNDNYERNNNNNNNPAFITNTQCQ